MPNLADLAFAVLFAVVLVFLEQRFFWPRFRAEVDSGVPDARSHAYRRIIVGQWLLVALGLALWVHAHRTAADLRLIPPSGWRLWASVAVIVVLGGLGVSQQHSIAQLSDDRRVALRQRLGTLEYILPHTRRESHWFLALSITAGVCEELLYRGYLVWCFAFWTGFMTAVAIGVILFGVGHAYQGARGMMRATLAGVLMGLILIATNWLVPAIIAHALIDGSSGAAAYRLLRETPA